MKKINLFVFVFMSIIVSLTVYANDKEDEWVKKHMTEEQEAKEKKEKADRAFLASPFKNYLLGSLKLSANFGKTNTSGFLAEENAVAQLRLRSSESVWAVKLGYFDKPVLRDIFLTGGQEKLDEYRKRKKDAFRWAWLDAVKLNMQFGFGKTIEENAVTDNFKTEEKTIYYIGISYQLPLSKFGNEFIE